MAGQLGLSLEGIPLIDAQHSHASATVSAELAARGEVAMLMKGSLHTDELMGAVLKRAELRTGRRMSHVFRFEVPANAKPLLVTDAAINIAPNLLEKADIIRNAIDLCHALGITLPKVAILAAIVVVGSSHALLERFAHIRIPFKDDVIRAFYNVCLHRGRKLRLESGRAINLRCPFHGFTWNNDGSLKEIPCAWDFKHLEDKDLSLPELKVERWQGFILITETVVAPPDDTHIVAYCVANPVAPLPAAVQDLWTRLSPAAVP